MERINIDDFCAYLDSIARPLDFTRDQFGRRILEGQGKRILDRAASQEGTEGRWEDNKGEYGREKRAKGIPVGTGLRPSKSPMLSAENVKGEPTITPDEASMTFGTSEGVRRIAVYYSADRPFYGTTEDDEDAIRSLAEDEIDRVIGGLA